MEWYTKGYWFNEFSQQNQEKKEKRKHNFLYYSNIFDIPINSLNKLIGMEFFTKKSPCTNDNFKIFIKVSVLRSSIRMGECVLSQGRLSWKRAQPTTPASAARFLCSTRPCPAPKPVLVSEEALEYQVFLFQC